MDLLLVGSRLPPSIGQVELQAEEEMEALPVLEMCHSEQVERWFLVVDCALVILHPQKEEH